MKLFASISLFVLGTLASAQSAGEGLLQMAYENMSSRGGWTITTDGFENFAGQQWAISSKTYVDVVRDANSIDILKIENIDYQANKLIYRSVGDGNSFWFYNARNNEYYSSRYRAWMAEPQDSGYVQSFSINISQWSYYPSTYCCRMINDIYCRKQTQFVPWFLSTKEYITRNGGIYIDPFLGGQHLFIARGNLVFVSYVMDNPLRKSVVYELVFENNTYRINRIFFNEIITIGDDSRVMNWVMYFTPGTKGANFSFTPPQGAKGFKN